MPRWNFFELLIGTPSQYSFVISLDISIGFTHLFTVKWEHWRLHRWSPLFSILYDYHTVSKNHRCPPDTIYRVLIASLYRRYLWYESRKKGVPKVPMVPYLSGGIVERCWINSGVYL